MSPTAIPERSALFTSIPVSKVPEKSLLKCDYCGMEKHTKKFCWKMNGKPQVARHEGESSNHKLMRLRQLLLREMFLEKMIGIDP